MSRFIVRTSALISKRTYWHGGVVLADESCRALVRADEEEGIIAIWVSGQDERRRPFLQTLRQNLRAIHQTVPRLKVAEKIPYGGVLVDYQHLLRLEEMGEDWFVPDGLEKRISVRDLLGGIEERSRRRAPAPRRASGEGDEQAAPAAGKRDAAVSPAEPSAPEPLPASWEKAMAFCAVLGLLVLAAVLLIRNEPLADVNLAVVLRSFVALCVATLGASLPGLVGLKLKGGWVVVRASGALALFVISYLLAPGVVG